MSSCSVLTSLSNIHQGSAGLIRTPMTKPTLVQSLLNRPSQTYSGPDVPKKEYYSTKQEMLRIAAEEAARKPSGEAPRVVEPVHLHVPQREEESDSDIDVFFTPNTSPRTSMASTGTARRKLSRRSLSSTDSPRPTPKPALPAVVAVPSTRTPSTSSTNYGSTQDRLSNLSISSTTLDAHSLYLDDTPDRSEGEREVTYNKAESGRWRNQRYAEEEWAKDVRWLVPPPSSSSKPASTTKTPAGTGGRSTTPASPQTNKKAPKTTSYAGEQTVRGKEREKPRPIASPPSAQLPQQRRQQPHTFSAFASIATPDTSSNTTATVSISKPQSLANGNARQTSSKPHGSSATTSTGSRAATSTPTSTNTTSRTSQGPASTSSQKNERPTSDAKKPHPISHSNNSDSTKNRSSTSSRTSQGQAISPPKKNDPKPTLTHRGSTTSSTVPPPTRTRNPKPKPISNMNGMSALMEEDEEGPLTPRMAHRDIDYGYGSSGSSKQEGGAKSTTTEHSRSLRHTSKPDALRRRRSRSLDSLSNSQHSSSISGSTLRKPPQTLQSEVNSLISSFSPAGERPSNGTQGYTSLVLPRAPPAMGTAAAANATFGLSLSPNGKIDLTRSGIAQTTMATVEVVQGLGASRAGIFGLFGRKRSLSSGTGHPGPLPLPLNGARRASADAGLPSADGLNPSVIKRRTTPLGFTSYRPPPNHVPSGSVLVQVWAVGLDGVDGRLVGVRFGAEAGGNRRRQQQEDAGQETERDDEDTEHEDEEEQRQNEETDAEELSTAQTNPSTKKGPLAALGRSLSLRLSRGGSTKRKENGHPNGNNHTDSSARSKPISPPKRSLSFSLKRSNTATSNASSAKTPSSSSAGPTPNPSAKRPPPKTRTRADVGYIPGRSFVGRVLECGWDVRDEVVRKGEWVVGLLDVRKGGALAEFIVVDRRRVHRVPQPWKTAPPVNDPTGPLSPLWIASPTPTQANLNIPSTLTLEELALLPLSGLPAYRAIRTFMFAFSSSRDGTASPGAMSSLDRRGAGFDFASSAASSSSYSDHHPQPSIRSTADHDHSYRRRILVLRGHDGTGAMAVQLLVQRGWRVSVHVPFSSVPSHASQHVGDTFMRVIEDRVRVWGADEVIFDDGEEGGGGDDGRGAAVRVLDSLREDGDVFDAVLDTVGGKEVREAGERLLRSPGFATSDDVPSPQRRGIGQFTTLVGDVPERVIPSAADNFRAGLRSFRQVSGPQTQDSVGLTANIPNGAAEEEYPTAASPVKGMGKVGYAWVSVAQDVDWEGNDVGETLGIVVRHALENGIRPIVEDVEDAKGEIRERVVSFERTPVIFVDDGPLRDGGTVVVKVAD
ncbi:hypothetical protein M413DRAFT_125606 [Hebeloma cylindrosporum]|uniref:Uncharacterized protein n=1 Tax=Hebeloma cylindrosporum TaxID=76867 RepID=A0A0C2YPD9_HEBCY|nr:hypothetical protein M413DRAFT_125606 [Hebeloma cylindrosporum h7]